MFLAVAIPFLTPVLDWLVLSWLFWPLLLAFVLLPHACLKDEDRFVRRAFPLVLAAVGLFWWRWPALLPGTLAGWGWLAISYALIGLTYSVIKWVGELQRFKREAPLAIADARALTAGTVKADDLAKAASRWLKYTSYGSHVKSDDHGAIYLNWRAFPVANWVTYWPWFLLSNVLDWVVDFGNKLVTLCRGLYEGLANRFKVKL